MLEKLTYDVESKQRKLWFLFLEYMQQEEIVFILWKHRTHYVQYNLKWGAGLEAEIKV